MGLINPRKLQKFLEKDRKSPKILGNSIKPEKPTKR